MSYFDDQMEAWEGNDCKGLPDQYDPYDPDSWPKHHTATLGKPEPKLTKSQKRNRARKRAKAAAKAAGK